MSVTGMPCEQLDRQADTTHLEQALFKMSSRLHSVSECFLVRQQPHERAEEMFALDVKVRCHKIHSDIH